MRPQSEDSDHISSANTLVLLQASNNNNDPVSVLMNIIEAIIFELVPANHNGTSPYNLLQNNNPLLIGENMDVIVAFIVVQLECVLQTRKSA